MRCQDIEQLIDSYLEGHLSGTLRLEFDAHRLRCRRCQQTVAMLEACEFVLTHDEPPVPELSPDFSQRVMTRLAEPGRAVRPWWARRSLRVAAVAINAAAVVVLAFLWSGRLDRPPLPARGLIDDPAIQGALDEAHRGYDQGDFVTLYDGLRRATELGLSARATVAQDFSSLARLATSLSFPDQAPDITAHPLSGFLQALLPVAPETDSGPASVGTFRL